MNDLLRALAATLLAVLPSAALADRAGEYTFTVSRDGDPVGV